MKEPDNLNPITLADQVSYVSKHIERIKCDSIRRLISNAFDYIAIYPESLQARQYLNFLINSLRRSPHAYLTKGVWIKEEKGKAVAIYDPGSSKTKEISLEGLCGTSKNKEMAAAPIWKENQGFSGYVLIDNVDLPNLNFLCYDIPHVMVINSTMEESIGAFALAGSHGTFYLSDMYMDIAWSPLSSTALNGKGVIQELEIGWGEQSLWGVGADKGVVQLINLQIEEDTNNPLSSIGKSNGKVYIENMAMKNSQGLLFESAGLGHGKVIVKGEIDIPQIGKLGDEDEQNNIYLIAINRDSMIAVSKLARQGIKILAPDVRINDTFGYVDRDRISEVYCISLNGEAFGSHFKEERRNLRGVRVKRITERMYEEACKYKLAEEQFDFLREITKRG